MRIPLAALAVALTCLAPSALAKGGGHAYHAPSASSRSSAHSSGSHSLTGAHSKAEPWVHRDAHGKIERSEKAKDEFKKSHPCPSTGKSSGSCPGYVIDHKQALKHGGADAPYNMQWQTEAAAKQKDKWE